MAPVENPFKGDFIKLVEEDYKMIEEKNNLETIGQMTKTQFKKNIKEKVKNVSLDELKDI